MKSFPSSFAIPRNDSNLNARFNYELTQQVQNKNYNNINESTQLSNIASFNRADSLNYLTLSSNKFIILNSEINVSNFGNLTNTNDSFNKTTEMKKVIYENAFKIPVRVLSDINRYKYVFKESAVDIEKISGEDENGIITVRRDVGVAQSLFNPWYGVRVQGITLSVPLYQPFNFQTNDPNSSDYLNPELKQFKITTTYFTNEPNINYSYSSEDIRHDIQLDLPANYSDDITDCSISTLVNLSGGWGTDGKKEPKENTKHSLGRAKYRWMDFMYCKDLGKVSNNHLITLRKFNAPIGDNINKWSTGNDNAPDVGRLISWFGTDDNKLEDICKYNYSASWKKLESEIQRIQSKEDQTDGKPLPSLINLTNPQYLSAVSKGIAGANNTFLSWFGEKSGILAADGGYQNSLSDYYHRDKNKVYEPKNTIRDTHIYEGALKFNQDITLTFSYKMRSYDGINQKSAFLDLLANILEVTYRRGRFWGGSISFEGAPRNQAGWKKVNTMIDTLAGKAGDGLTTLFNMPLSDWGQIFNSTNLMNAFSSMTSGLDDLVSKGQEALNTLQNGGSFSDVANNMGAGKGGAALGKAILGMMKNKLGRPQVYAMDSLLSGSPVGLWHLTVGNPRNPIMSMGNLILENATVQHTGPLGIDDFPTELKVTVTLKHAKSRDITDIAQMYTGGGDIYHAFNGKEFKKYFPEVWTERNVSDKVEYIDTKTGQTTDEYRIKTYPAFSSINNASGTTLQARPEPAPPSTIKPIPQSINGNTSYSHADKANFGWGGNEIIQKLQLLYVLNNLSK